MRSPSGPIARLLGIAGSPLSPLPARLEPPLLGDVRTGELARLLQSRNGFLAFESALHVFPVGRTSGLIDLSEWNSDTLWRHEYGDMAKGFLFFAEDIFGNQFCIRDGEVHSFEAETGETELTAHDLAGWAERVMAEYDVMTGSPLAHEWQSVNGPIALGRRLLPKVPFVAGGEFSVQNLYDGDAVEGMRFRGFLASKIRNLPDGSQIEFKITP